MWWVLCFSCLAGAERLTYQPSIPATQTRAMADILRRTDWRVEIVFALRDGFEGSTNGVAGERCVPSIVGWRNEEAECLRWLCDSSGAETAPLALGVLEFDALALAL